VDKEDVRHMLFTCPDAVHIWKGLGIDTVIQDAMVPGRSGSEILGFLLNASHEVVPGFESIQLREMIAVSAWYIWWNRRRKSHGENVPPVQNCVNSIRAITANSAKAKALVNVAGQKWLKPRSHYVKVNVDAAFVIEEKAGSAAAVMRDTQGLFIAGSGMFIPHVGSVLMAEAMAVLHGLKMAQNMNYSAVEVESDSLEVIQYCTGAERIWSEATAIFAEIMAVAGSIGMVEFNHCTRDMNRVAHDIARFSFSSRADCNWVDEPPSFILQPLLDDVTYL
jgi:ribonuclease HI